jgi:hypothetical protein
MIRQSAYAPGWNENLGGDPQPATMRKKAEKELKKNQDRLEALV